MSLLVVAFVLAIQGALGVPTPSNVNCPLFPSEYERIGINVANRYDKTIADYDVTPFHLGWYLEYDVQVDPPYAAGAHYVQMLSALHYPVSSSKLHPIIDANPGAIWILGNEPDRRLLQDDRTPEQYVRFYHDAYYLIKERDPQALVAVGAVVQPSPLRLRYLEMVLAAYSAEYGYDLPTDIWTVHNFILPEKANDWGADIPPGLDEYAHLGKNYTVYDHGRMDLFQQQIVDFRVWLTAHGYRNKPLLVSEYGILMPPLYGYDEATVRAFMLDSFNFFRTAVDAHTGYAADGNRLVQGWAWYSLNDLAYDPETRVGFNGHLLDFYSGEITSLGQVFAAYTTPLVDHFTDLIASDVAIEPGLFVDPAARSVVTITARLLNGGNLSAQNAIVTLWKQDPVQGDIKVAQATVDNVLSHCRRASIVPFTWVTDAAAHGLHRFSVTVDAGEPDADRHTDNNRVVGMIYLLAPGQLLAPLYLPQVENKPYISR